MSKLRRLKRDVRRIWERVPTLPCTGACLGACGVILMSPAEEQVIGMEYGGVPVHDEETLSCSALSPEGRCSIYEHRPLICRLYGVAEGLECHAGCVPAAGLLTKHQAKALLREMDAIMDDGALR